MRKLLPPYLTILAILLMVAGHFLLPQYHWDLGSWHHAGWLLFPLGIALSISGKKLFARRETNINTFRDPGQLVTDGPFRFSRNPMYLGFVIALTGIAIGLASLPPFVVLISYFLITDRWYIRFEETRMREIFGRQYDDYCTRTRRWI